MKQISAIERLKSLPPVFRGADLTVRFQWTSKTASQYLYLWKRRGLVDGLGGHSDVYANLLTTSAEANWDKALLTAMPSAVLIGIEALRLAGWTTQIPRRPDVAVDARQPVFATARFTVIARSADWFEATRDAVLRTRAERLPVLPAAWALADLLRESDWGAFGLWPDDIAWSDVTRRDEQQWQAACGAFALPSRALASLRV